MAAAHGLELGVGCGSCVTGDYRNALACAVFGTPLAEYTLATLDIGDDTDYSDLSVIEGFNALVSFQPTNNVARCAQAAP
ncbi:hypothetical protein E2562_020366 [Oryza meyeriana var. granulata]|uniref:Uncharacterized protein n=1 Tax=Oryza meyeriana var. granulata TaxID=110450 RepID=A0A6G1DNB9_9ORYZ|nr:hypothetical protein E2562_020366 [Oryza meyeriana var. granulata]